MLTETRYVRVPFDERTSRPSENRTVRVPADGRGYPPIFVIIDGGTPGTAWIYIIDAGGPTSTYPLIDGNL